MISDTAGISLVYEGRLLRVRIAITGAVQGVGFRPFVYRLATDMGLTGWVNNSAQGVTIEAEGIYRNLQAFLARIEQDKPALSMIRNLTSSFLDPVGYTAFEIRHSTANGAKTTLVLPDIATCRDCRREIFDPSNRRYLYPFTNCTHCGPRYSIIEALPYDRPNTTMKIFPMCPQCRAEYEDPLDRRFHAQPTACPRCGPHLELWDRAGRVLASHHDALVELANAITAGAVVAIKGLGGFQLLVDARNEDAVRRLRERKHREEKPFALMYPSLLQLKADCRVSDVEKRLLLSTEAPIVVLRRLEHMKSAIAPSVAPHNPNIGVMLPYTPLHHLLMTELDIPIVATSGNLSDEPICIDEHEALINLGQIADLFLVHNRPIARHVDDSVVRVIAGRPMVMRRARGYAPLPIHVENPLPPLVATGAHLKNTVAISSGHDIFLSQHIGDLETVRAFGASKRALADLRVLYDLRPSAVACDLHPNYLSTQAAEDSGLPLTRVQHHYAHVLACMTENRLEAPVLGVSWDGTGYGDDGTVWGGEFLRITATGFERVAHLRTFRLPGGDSAAREPRRSAIGLLYELYGDDLFGMTDLAPIQAFTAQERKVLRQMLRENVNSPLTSSAGRLFDAVASILGLRQCGGFEGQAAMELEFATDGMTTGDSYPFKLSKNGMLTLDWATTIVAIIKDTRRGVPVPEIAARFHNTLAEMILAVGKKVGEPQVALTGGCFQNKALTEETILLLRSEGFQPAWHQHIPPNDGGIALGQIVAAAREQSI